MVQSWKNLAGFMKLNMQLPYILAIPLMGIHAREMKTYGP